MEGWVKGWGGRRKSEKIVVNFGSVRLLLLFFSWVRLNLNLRGGID